MLRATAEALKRQLLEAFPPTEAYGFEDLSRDSMPDLIGHFLGQVLHRRIAQMDVRIQSDWFDYTNPNVRNAEQHWREALMQATRFPAAVWEQTLEQAIRLVLLYLLRPVQTLTTFLFGSESDTLSIDLVKARMQHFNAYPYLSDVLDAYIARHELTEIEKSDFSKVMMLADQKMTADYNADAWLQTLDPLFTLMDQIQSQRGRGIPTALIRLFFEQKNQKKLANRFLLEEDLRERRSMDRESLHQILDRALDQEQESAEPSVALKRHEAMRPQRSSTQAGPRAGVPRWMQYTRTSEGRSEPQPAAPRPTATTQMSEPPVREEPEDAAPIPAPEPNVAPSRPAASSKQESPSPTEPASWSLGRRAPMPEDFVDPDAAPVMHNHLENGHPDVGEPMAESPGDGTIAGELKDSGVPDVQVASSAERTIPLWMRFQRQKETPGYVPVQSDSELEELEHRVLADFEEDQRSWYVQHLFGGSIDAYTTVLRKLGTAHSWKQASQIIAQEVFQEYTVNIYSESAVAFTDAVEARFR